MTGFVNFWVGLVGRAAAILWFCADWIYLSRGLPWLPRAVGVACGAIAALFIAWIAGRDAPLRIVAISPSETYQNGADILGIKWKNSYSPVEIMISNAISSDYGDVNVYARTNLMISEVGVRGHINQCVATPELPFVEIAGATLSFKDSSGKNISIPVFRGDQPITSSVYHIRCDKLISKSRIDVALAVATNAAQKLNWVALSAGYVGLNRERTAFLSKCFTSLCSDMPKAIGK
jgi:hypothetical protein